jgi:hypothetical protein
VGGGYFSVLLGSLNPLSEGDFGGNRYLQVSVDSGSGSQDLPRQPLAAVPYAFKARSASAVPWSGLKGVPPGLADGTDDDSLGGLACGEGQVPKWNGASGGWNCADDQSGGGGSFWSLSGNADTVPGSHFLGTTDAVSLTLAVSGTTALRIEPASDSNWGYSPNIVGGYSGNSATATVAGATIGGGGSAAYPNSVSGLFPTVGGGLSNAASGGGATVGGGVFNTASDDHSTVGGGSQNQATAAYATIAGGGGNDPANGNRVTDEHGTVGGGSSNQAGDDAGTASDVAGATVGGGTANTASGGYSFIGGGFANIADNDFATVGGGFSNAASGAASTIGGGQHNTVTASMATVGGGGYNVATVDFATIGGGGSNDPASGNRVTDEHGTVGGGAANQAGDDAGTASDAPGATVGGGTANTASGGYSFIGGGFANIADNDFATVGGGFENTASGAASAIGGGQYNTVTASMATVGGGGYNVADGLSSTIPGGSANAAAGDYSFAAGRRAKANGDGCFVWGDSTDADVNCDTANKTVFRSSGGFTIYTTPTLSSGVELPAGSGTWNSLSDRNVKENVEPVDGQEVLDRLAGVPISTWNYTTQDEGIRHLGPMAQDFAAAFGLGGSERHISTIDADGVALAAIKGLYERSLALEAENAAQQTRIEELEGQVAEFEARLSALEAAQGAGVDRPVAGATRSRPVPLPAGGLLLGGLVLAWLVAGGRRWTGGRP